jgi:hypothetical protein
MLQIPDRAQSSQHVAQAVHPSLQPFYLRPINEDRAVNGHALVFGVYSSSSG